MVKLIQIAASLTGRTKAAAKAALKLAGLKQTLCNDLLVEAMSLDKKRAAKLAARSRRHNNAGKRPKYAVLPPGTLAQRLAKAREHAVFLQFFGAYRVATHGALDVKLTDDPACVGVSQFEGIDRDGYAKSCQYAMRTQDTIITAPAGWRVRVQRKGLAVLGGLMTLDAAPIQADGCELYAATWLVQGRGTSVAAERGYIARAGDISYHGKTADQALTGLIRKQRALALTLRLASADLGDLVSKCPGALVTVGDARATGACAYGIRSWCNQVGITVAYDEATGHITGEAALSTVYAAYQREPRREAHATVLHVLRRQRTIKIGA